MVSHLIRTKPWSTATRIGRHARDRILSERKGSSHRGDLERLTVVATDNCCGELRVLCSEAADMVMLLGPNRRSLLFHSAFFYGHAMSSLVGVIINMRAARGADPRTMFLE
ncbi:hypothetical protein BGY98DRAFT_358340 [Russula aff. rugulosa BPL654]|nr:hypothetical protein BGY98DRAFT_358340 [Russula aff. rugulosa BPL654]